MNRPRLVGILSAVIGSTAGFLVLSRWRLAGTISGAVVVPVIYTIVSHCSHESLLRVGGWMRRRAGRGADPVPSEPARAEDAPPDKTPVRETMRPTGHKLLWSVTSLAVLAFAVSVYSLAHSDSTNTTILREKVVVTITVTTEQSTSVVARSSNLHSPAASPTAGLDAPNTTTTTPSHGVLPTTTVSTVAGSDIQTTTTTLQ